MILNNNSTNFEIDKPVIIPSSSSSEEFEIKSLTDACRNSGTGMVYIDDCISSKIKEFILCHGLFTGTTQKLNDVNNPYFKICGADDYLKVQHIKTNNGTIITNDYGMFVCAYLEGLKPIYLPTKEQLKKGKIYFTEKIFKKKINNIIWRLRNR